MYILNYCFSLKKCKLRKNNNCTLYKIASLDYLLYKRKKYKTVFLNNQIKNLNKLIRRKLRHLYSQYTFLCMKGSDLQVLGYFPRVSFKEIQ